MGKQVKSQKHTTFSFLSQKKYGCENTGFLCQYSLHFSPTLLDAFSLDFTSKTAIHS